MTKQQTYIENCIEKFLWTNGIDSNFFENIEDELKYLIYNSIMCGVHDESIQEEALNYFYQYGQRELEKTKKV